VALEEREKPGDRLSNRSVHEDLRLRASAFRQMLSASTSPHEGSEALEKSVHFPSPVAQEVGSGLNTGLEARGFVDRANLTSQRESCLPLRGIKPS